MKNLTLNQDINHKGYSFINFSLINQKGEEFIITVLPTLDEIPDFMIPNWIKNIEEKQVYLNVIERFGYYYMYESERFWYIKNIL